MLPLLFLERFNYRKHRWTPFRTNHVPSGQRAGLGRTKFESISSRW